MLTIGEFARLAGVSARMLRHYDALGLLVPTQVDPFTGYRRYDPDLLPRAHQLVALKELGFGLDQVAELLRGASPGQIRALLERRRAELAGQIDRDSARLIEVERRLRLIQGGTTMEFIETTLPAIRLAQLTGEVAEQGEIAGVVGPLFQRLFAAYHGQPAEPALAWYAGDGDRLRLGVAVAEAGPVPAGLDEGALAAVPRALCATYAGAIGGIGEAWQNVGAELTARGLEAGEGPCREVYHRSMIDGADDWVIELQQPVA